MLKFLLAAFFFLILSTTLLHAHDTSIKCSNTKSTGDQLQCLNTHYEKQQTELNTAFTAALNDLTPQQLTTMKTAQNAWVVYRDLECSFEANSTENASLERMETLKCLSALTKNRIHAIATVEDKDPTSHLGTLPRWMNVLGGDHPNILWNYTGRIEGDFDCDTQNEYAMGGVQTAPDSTQKAVIAIAENAKTGKPKTYVFDIPSVSGTKKCNMKMSLSLFTASESEEPKSTSCITALKIRNEPCYSALITFSDKEFSLGANLLADIPLPEEKPNMSGADK